MELTNYQKKIVRNIIHLRKCGLFLKMNSGKTIITLTAINYLLQKKEISKVLIIAPLKVCRTTWCSEIDKWEHLKGLTYSVVIGTAKQRAASLMKDADVYIINPDNVGWLCGNYKWVFDAVIVDESTAFKSKKAKRTKVLAKTLEKNPPKCVYLLSGTPSPNSLMDLWSQIYLLDFGERLGNYNQFLMEYFDKSIFSSWFVYSLKPGADIKIINKIKDICFTSNDPDAKEYPIRFKNEIVELPKKVRKDFYEKLEKEFFISFEEGDVNVSQAAVLTNKLLQLSNGAIYTDNGYEIVHTEKIDRLAEIVADNPGENIVVVYNYKHDLEIIMKRFPKDAVLLDREGKQIDAWNKGLIKMLLCHPQSAAHGINLQQGGSIMIWYGLTWSYEGYKQMNARLPRRGQKNTVSIIRIVMKNTIDGKVLRALKNKHTTNTALLKNIYKDMKINK